MGMKFESLIKCADAGNIEAMVIAIQEYVWNEHMYVEESHENTKKILGYLKIAIEAGNTDAMNQMGAMYAEGRFVDEDKKKAYEFYKMAADKGHALAITNLGFCYLYGLGIDINEREAYMAFSKAAALGMGEALVRLGDMFYQGIYVSEDKKNAFEMYKSAAAMASKDLEEWVNMQIYSDASRRLGDCFYYGEGAEVDKTEAVHWYGNALYYYMKRNEKGDAYCYEGLEKTVEQLKHMLIFMRE